MDALAEETRRAEESVVRVTIGRIDVRAPEHAPAPMEPRRATEIEPLQLNDYLRERDAGER
jgi:hypothetical protein